MRFLTLLVCLVTTLNAAEPFKSGDSWIAVGDSISTNGVYAQNIELFYLTRYPDRPLAYINAGIPGDTANGVLKRFDWDVAYAKPTVATVMLGMNDVNRGKYAADQDQPKLEARHAATIATYDKNLREITARLQGIGSRVVLLSPTPFDDTMRKDGTNLPGCNDALAEFGRRARVIAAETGAEFIDLHTPMTTLNRRLQAKSPEFTLISGDRIHPGQPGHFVAAYYFLQAQGVRGTVAIAHLDAATSSVRRADNCIISDFTGTERSVQYTYLADALPFPVSPEAAPALDWVPFQTELNREEFRVQGLAPGTYQLKIDDQNIATFDAADLARGVNLAEFPTPQLAQARKVLELLQKRWFLIGKIRIVPMVEHHLGGDLPRPFTLEAIEPALATWEAQIAATPNHWQRNHPAEYREQKPVAAERPAQAAALLEEARAAAEPKARRISLSLLVN